MRNQILEQVKEAIRSPYAWPGGYPVYMVMADGLMCPKCARENYRLIVEATNSHDRHSGWKAEGATVLYEGEECCCHCGCELESAYGPTEDNEE